jgi:Ankyrin repeats (3 copies)/Ankyrin repeats (many copies)
MTFPALILVGLLIGQATTPGSLGADADLLESAKLGQSARVKELLAKGASVNTADRRGFTPLIWASASGNLATVRQLIESGAGVDRRTNDGFTALMLASANGFTEVARALLLRGADVNAARGTVKARQLALERGQSDVATLLEQAEALGTRLLRAAAEGNDTAVRQLLAAGTPVNVTDERGATALMMAARNGDLGILQALLSRGADASVRDGLGQGVFEWAEPSAGTSKYVIAFLGDHGLSREGPRRIAPIEPPQVKASLATLAAVLSRIPPASAPMRMVQRRANAALSQLQALSVKWPTDSPEDYRDNLSGDVKALESVLQTGDVETVAATIQSVAEDLEIKLEHCNRSGGKLGGSVTVRVRTVQGGDEIKSWQVFYMPRVFEAAANASPDLFPQLSSPTEETLVPGRYVMWVRDPASARVGERTVVKVGEGKKELILDLPVPAVKR